MMREKAPHPSSISSSKKKKQPRCLGSS